MKSNDAPAGGICSALGICAVVRICCSLLATVLSLSPIAEAQPRWGQFRGPTGQGQADTATPPLEFGEDLHCDWKTAIPGRGWSSPVVDQGGLWITTALRNPEPSGSVTLAAMELDPRTGELRRSIPLFEVADPPEIHADNSYASPTPVLDDERLYCHFGRFGTAAVDRKSGAVVWRNTDLVIEHQGGPGSSPIPYRNLLIVTCDGADRDFVTALDQATGAEVWRRERSAAYRSNPITHRAFATPLLWQDRAGDLLISVAADQTHAYRPADGSEVWHVRYEGFSNVPAPVAWENRIFICTGFYAPQLLAIKTGGQGDVTATQVSWTYKRGVSTIPSPLIVEGRLFLLNETGILVAIDTETGRVLRKRRFAGSYSASPLLADGRIYLCSEQGKISVLGPGEDLDLLQVNRVDGEIKASPAVCGEWLFLRTATHMYGFAVPTASPTP